MAVKWIIADVDGCISPEESRAWEWEGFAELVQTCRRANAGEGPVAPMTLCTGRPQPYVEVMMKLLDVRAPAICENGAVIYTLHDNRARYGPGVTAQKIAGPGGLRALRAFLDADVLPRHPTAVMQFGKEAQLSIFSADPAALAPVRAEVEAWARTQGGPALCITMSHYYLNLSLAGVTKGAALEAVMRELGVSRDEVAGIGDTEGDLPLRQAVGFFACPANATAPIKAVADYVSPHPMVRGVLDILGRPQLRRMGGIASSP